MDKTKIIKELRSVTVNNKETIRHKLDRAWESAFLCGVVLSLALGLLATGVGFWHILCFLWPF